MCGMATPLPIAKETICGEVRYRLDGAWMTTVPSAEQLLALGTARQLLRGLDWSVVVKATVAGLDEVTRWILRGGKDATAVAPVALRARLIEELREAARRYEGGEG